MTGVQTCALPINDTAYEIVKSDWSSDVCSSDLDTAYEIVKSDWSSDVCSSDPTVCYRLTLTRGYVWLQQVVKFVVLGQLW